MPNWKSRSDTEAWWSSQPGNRGKTYPGDEMAEKKYQRNQAAGENNLSMLKNFASRVLSGKTVDLGPPAKSSYPMDSNNAVSLAKDEDSYKKGGKVKSAKKKLHPNW
jgi:hypothetical protein